MPRINLLPWRAQERRERKNTFLVWMAAAVAGGLLASGGF
jgi:Tfp pilus assembly protein PilN